MKQEIKAYRPINPSPAALITSVDEFGVANIVTLAEVFNVSIGSPVIVGIAIRPATYSHGLISDSRQFVINLPTTAILAKVDRCGTVSGGHCADKFAEFGLTAIPSLKVAPPSIEECPVNVECEVLQRITVGDHDLFLGNVVAVRVDSDKVDAQGELIKASLDPLVYIAGEYWSVGERLGAHGFTAREGSR